MPSKVTDRDQRWFVLDHFRALKSRADRFPECAGGNTREGTTQTTPSPFGLHDGTGGVNSWPPWLQILGTHAPLPELQGS